MKKNIQIIEVSTGNIHTEIKTLEQLIQLFQSEVFEEEYQRKNAVERLLLSGEESALSMNCVWRAKFISRTKKKVSVSVNK